MATLINGNGNPAVYAQQDADFYIGSFGTSTRILGVGSKMAHTIEDANTIAVADGVILTKEGRRVQVDVGSVDEFTIPTGATGVTRYYIIGFHLYTDGSGNQKAETFVQLMADESETITENTFRGGASEVYISLYRVKQIGLNLDTISLLLPIGTAVDDIIGDTDISGIGDGTLTGGLSTLNNSLTEIHTWTLTSSSWTANSDTATQDLYPYVYTISSSLFKNDSVPLWDCMGTASSGIPTATEVEAIALVQDFYCNTSGITLYAVDAPAVNIVLRVKGA